MQPFNILAFGISLISWLAAPVFAASIAEEKATFCGSGWSEALVPDNVAGCVLTEACRLHDICYGRCDPGGDLHGSNYCSLGEDSEARQMSKKQCDQRLHDDIAALNDNRKLCSGVGSFYQYVVSRLGQGPFNGREQLPLYLLIYESSGSELEANKKFEAVLTLERRGLIKSGQTIQVENEDVIVPVTRAVDSPLSRDPRNVVLPRSLDDAQIRQLQTAPVR